VGDGGDGPGWSVCMCVCVCGGAGQEVCMISKSEANCGGVCSEG